jgi:hypothetical protein
VAQVGRQPKQPPKPGPHGLAGSRILPSSIAKLSDYPLQAVFFNVTSGTDREFRHALLAAITVLRGHPMFILNSDVGTTETDEKILTFDVPDDALERAAAVSDGQAAHTIGYCTHWYHCNWPL